MTALPASRQEGRFETTVNGMGPFRKEEDKMDLKVLSGVLITRDHEKGKAIIDLARNDLVGGDLEARDLKREKIIAPPGLKNSYFDEEPCRTIGLREIRVHTVDRDDFGSRPPRAEEDHFEINSTATSTRLTISWAGTGASRVEEISYLAIGPVSSPTPGPG